MYDSTESILLSMPAIGSRAQVWHGSADHTKGGLQKKDLMKNKHGRIVSRKKHFTAKREKRLVKAGFLTRKGHFGFVQKKHSRRRGRRLRGGSGHGPLQPADF